MAKGWLDNFGKEENYNDSQTTAPKGFEGDGYSNVGRNYSPAWGGQFQMGGNVYPVNYVPQAQGGMSMPGSVGFSYARTQGIPYNGPGAKKTMASAQEGVKLDMYGAPITAIEVNDPSSNRTSYDARTNRMILGSDTNAENRDKAIAHENYHASQYADNRMNYDIAHHTDNEQWARMQKQPAMTSNNEGWSNYYDRKPREKDDLVNNFINNSDFLKNYTNTVKQGSPSAANDIIFNTVYDKTNTDKALYLNPGTSEGEAQRYEDTGIRSFQNGGEMRYYQNGLDWKPKSISRDGGWLNQYEDGGIVKGDQDGYRNPKNRGKVVEILGDEMGTDGYNDTLYVVPDVGEPRIVYANTGNHKFPGASKFTEYPVAQNGLRQEQKSLQNLDNLVNFTNYNNKQPGGWLDQI